MPCAIRFYPRPVLMQSSSIAPLLQFLYFIETDLAHSMFQDYVWRLFVRSLGQSLTSFAIRLRIYSTISFASICYLLSLAIACLVVFN